MKIIRIAKDSIGKLLLPIIILAICLLSFYPSALGGEIAEKEPNNEIPQANSIQLGTKIKGYLAQADDLDYFEFVVPEEGEILKIELSGPPQVDVNLQLYREDKEMIQEINLLGEGKGENFIWAKAPKGTYYLALEPLWEQANENEPYTLTVVLFKEEARLVNPQALARAIEKGLSWLAKNQNEDGSWDTDYGKTCGVAGLGLLAFLEADKTLVSKHQKNIQEAVNFHKKCFHSPLDYSDEEEKALKGGLIYNDIIEETDASDYMYSHGIATMALAEAYSRGDKSFKSILEQALDLIVRSQNTEHKPDILEGPIEKDSPGYGGWRYYPSDTDSDISVSGWQIVALKALEAAGFAVPEWSWEAIIRFMKECYLKEEGGFVYMPEDTETGCARTGMGVLSLQLAGQTDCPEVKGGLEYIWRYPPLWETEQKGEGYPFYYWYYASRAMYLTGGDDWENWSSLMAQMLLKYQDPDGSWPMAESEEWVGPAYSTALATLILEMCQGHLPLYLQKKKAGTELEPITFYATVTDSTGKYITNLKNADFYIEEDGQTVEEFNVATELLPSSIVLVLDRSGSMKKAMEETKKAAQSFVELLAPNDEAMVIAFDHEIKIVQNFTRDRESLKTALATIKARGGTALYDTILEAIEKASSGKGRPAIILLTDGADENIKGTDPGSKHTLEEALTQIEQKNIPIYTLGLGANVNQEVLQKISSSSGARFCFSLSTKELEKIYEEIAAELKNQYKITFISPNPVADGTWRNVSLKVILKVHTKEGYYAR